MEAIVKRQDSALQLKPEDIQLIKDQICPGLGDNELKLFLYNAQKRGLDPLTRQIYAVQRWNKALGRKSMTIQTSIDGFRLIAERSGKYKGQVGPFWCGTDGEWKDVWLDKQPPAAAKVGVYRDGFPEPIYAVANWEAYASPDSPMWVRMPSLMLGKCAEALALRKAFAEDLSGIYTADEMDQAKENNTIDTLTSTVEMNKEIGKTDDLPKMAWEKPKATPTLPPTPPPIVAPEPIVSEKQAIQKPQETKVEPEAKEEPAKKGNFAPWWAKTFNSNGRNFKWIFARCGNHFPESWLVEHGFMLGPKAWKKQWDETTEKACREQMVAGAAPVKNATGIASPSSEWHPSTLDMELLHNKADLLGLTETQRAALLEMIPAERRVDPSSWLEKDYNKIKNLLDDELKARKAESR